GGRPMRNLLASTLVRSEEISVDENGQVVTNHWLFPDQAELIYGTTASIIIFALLWKYAGPPIMKAFRARTERIDNELNSAQQAVDDANADAERIRGQKGDIDAERRRLFNEADAQAEALLTDGRARLENEVAELEARAVAEIESAANRSGDELRSDIARIVTESTDRVVADTLDESTDRDLIEAFIQRVGASS
ncbi:MAG: F0F1 ATP synthase subunit B, partial [Ilumatobacteraceae bacterium]